jgi:hypothetical protein
MLASIFQLSGTILLALMVAFRQKNEYKRLIEVVLPVQGEKNPRLLPLFKETWTFRIGLVYLIIGTIFQVLGIVVHYLESFDVANKLFVSAVIITVLVYFGLKISNIIALKSYEKVEPWSPDGDNHTKWSMMIEP